MSDVLDLDVLGPKPRTVKFGEKLITVNPPKTVNIFRLGSLGEKLQGAADMRADEIQPVVDELTKEIVLCIPELDGVELNAAQLIALVELISDMGMPDQAKELERRGITPKSGPKVQ